MLSTPRATIPATPKRRSFELSSLTRLKIMEIRENFIAAAFKMHWNFLLCDLGIPALRLAISLAITVNLESGDPFFHVSFYLVGIIPSFNYFRFFSSSGYYYSYLALRSFPLSHVCTLCSSSFLPAAHHRHHFLTFNLVPSSCSSTSTCSSWFSLFFFPSLASPNYVRAPPWRPPFRRVFIKHKDFAFAELGDKKKELGDGRKVCCNLRVTFLRHFSLCHCSLPFFSRQSFIIKVNDMANTFFRISAKEKLACFFQGLRL